MSEHDQQSAVVDWWGKTHRDHKNLLMAYPSGSIIGGKNKWGQISKLKKEGWRKGVPDLFLAMPRNGFGGLWIEMKDLGKTKSSLSEDQVRMMGDLSEQGFLVVWCAGAVDAIRSISDYLNKETGEG